MLQQRIEAEIGRLVVQVFSLAEKAEELIKEIEKVKEKKTE